MLSDDALEKLMKPIIDRQESINIMILTKMANTIDEMGKLLPSDIYTLERLYKSGANMQLINKELARLTKLQERDIKKLIKTVAADSYKDAKPFYDHTKSPYLPFEENVELQKVVKAVAKATTDEYVNIAKAQAFMLRDNNGKLKPTSLAKTYQKVVDNAIQAVQGGFTDYTTAMRNTVKELAQSGYRRVVYETEDGRLHTQRADTAVRRNIMDGVRAINQGVQDITGQQYGADGKEITVHNFSAPDHEPIQGHQFTNEEYDNLQHGLPFKDYNGKEFDPIKRPIGQWNCRHFTYSIILGITKPNYNEEELKKLNEENAKGITLPNEKHLTKYECTQRMRQLETQIRYAKEGQITAKEAGDMVLATEYQVKILKLMDEYEEFCKLASLRTQWNRAFVDGYKPLTQKEYQYA